MGIEASGVGGISFRRVRAWGSVVGVAVGLAFYFYGPSITPLFQAAAHASCNEATDGSYRHYRLEWVVDSQPHWSCFDTSSPADPPVNLGWWVTP